MLLPTWSAITDFGHSGFLLPVATLMAAWLIAGGAWRLALVWLSALGLAVVLVAVTKIAFLGWGIGIRTLDFTGISGHTMLATAVFPVAADFLCMRCSLRARIAVITGGLLLAAIVGLSRYFVGAHTPAEIVAGFIVGAMVATSVLRYARKSVPPKWPAWTMAVAVFAVLFFVDGHKPEAHGLIVKLALQVSGRDHPYSRAEWRLCC